jgi:hypothetical protein
MLTIIFSYCKLAAQGSSGSEVFCMSSGGSCPDLGFIHLKLTGRYLDNSLYCLLTENMNNRKMHFSRNSCGFNSHVVEKIIVSLSVVRTVK